MHRAVDLLVDRLTESQRQIADNSRAHQDLRDALERSERSADELVARCEDLEEQLKHESETREYLSIEFYKADGNLSTLWCNLVAGMFVPVGVNLGWLYQHKVEIYFTGVLWYVQLQIQTKRLKSNIVFFVCLRVAVVVYYVGLLKGYAAEKQTSDEYVRTLENRTEVLIAENDKLRQRVDELEESQNEVYHREQEVENQRAAMIQNASDKQLGNINSLIVRENLSKLNCCHFNDKKNSNFFIVAYQFTIPPWLTPLAVDFFMITLLSSEGVAPLT